MDLNIATIIIACIGSTGMFSLVQYLISRKDNRKDELKSIKSTVNNVELGCTRTQLMFLMRDYGDKTEEIMKVAYHYFVDLEGDWYMTSLFADYCKSRGLEVPDWSKEK